MRIVLFVVYPCAQRKIREEWLEREAKEKAEKEAEEIVKREKQDEQVMFSIMVTVSLVTQLSPGFVTGSSVTRRGSFEYILFPKLFLLICIRE